jgi:hypothetical protein
MDKMNKYIFIGLLIIFADCKFVVKKRKTITSKKSTSIKCTEIQAKQLSFELYTRLKENLSSIILLDELKNEKFEYCSTVTEIKLKNDIQFVFTRQLKIRGIEFASIKREKDSSVSYILKINGQEIKKIEYFGSFTAKKESELNLQLDYSSSIIFSDKNIFIILTKSNQWSGIMANDFYFELVDIKKLKIIKGYIEIDQ